MGKIPSSVMDQDASPAEIRQQQEAMQQSYDRDAEFEAENAGSKGEGMPYDPFFGSSPADVKARRQARGAYAEEDCQPTPPDPIDSYNGPRSGAEVRTMEELSSHVGHRMDLARERYPDFDEVIYGHVIPRLREAGLDENDPQVQRWLMSDDFAEAAYLFGRDLKNQPQLPKDFRNMHGDELREWLDANYGSGHRASEEPPRPDSRRDMKRMNKIENPEDFARALDAWKLKGD